MFIPDPKTATKERDEKKLLSYLVVATNFTKLKIILFELLKKKIWANLKKIVIKLSKICFWYPRSTIRDPEKPIPDPGSRGQKGTGSRIRIRNIAF
jgi:hypothetical protein